MKHLTTKTCFFKKDFRHIHPAILKRCSFKTGSTINFQRSSKIKNQILKDKCSFPLFKAVCSCRFFSLKYYTDFYEMKYKNKTFLYFGWNPICKNLCMFSCSLMMENGEILIMSFFITFNVFFYQILCQFNKLGWLSFPI